MKSKILVSLFFVIFYLSCKDQKSESSSATEVTSNNVASEYQVELTKEQLKNSGIITGIPVKREMHTSLKVNGVVDVPPENIISVSMPLGGYLKNTSMIPGTRVRKGDILATLEDQQYIQLQQDFLTSKSRLEYNEADFNRQKLLYETKSTSEKIFQQAKTDFETQKILTKAFGEKLQLIGIDPYNLKEENISRSVHIISPINGYVTKVNVNIGKYISPSDVIFELINPSDLHVRLTVFENDAANLSSGQKILCSTNSNPEIKYPATIHLITPNIEENRSTDVHCHLEGSHKKLFPGTFVNAEIELNNANVIALPEEALVKWESKYYLFSQESESKFRLFPVEIGASSNGYVEIKTALPSTKIVVKNAYTLLMKLKNSGEE
jgi:cobalt-zinc-cadmium efflux system membrane fusion protein